MRARARLAPVESRVPWIGGGFALEAIAAGGLAAYVVTKAKHEGVGGMITRATIRLAWHQAIHAHAGLAILAASALLFAAGAMALARPYVKDPITWCLAVPVAAVAGLLVFGVAALVVALLIMLASADVADVPWGDTGGSAVEDRRRRKRGAAGAGPDT